MFFNPAWWPLFSIVASHSCTFISLFNKQKSLIYALLSKLSQLSLFFEPLNFLLYTLFPLYACSTSLYSSKWQFDISIGFLLESRITSVQVCDARMLNRNSFVRPKKIKHFLDKVISIIDYPMFYLLSFRPIKSVIFIYLNLRS